jgi:hypothetical protein
VVALLLNADRTDTMTPQHHHPDDNHLPSWGSVTARVAPEDLAGTAASEHIASAALANREAEHDMELETLQVDVNPPGPSRSRGRLALKPAGNSELCGHFSAGALTRWSYASHQGEVGYYKALQRFLDSYPADEPVQVAGDYLATSGRESAVVAGTNAAKRILAAQ